MAATYAVKDYETGELYGNCVECTERWMLSGSFYLDMIICPTCKTINVYRMPSKEPRYVLKPAKEIPAIWSKIVGSVRD